MGFEGSVQQPQLGVKRVLVREKPAGPFNLRHSTHSRSVSFCVRGTRFVVWELQQPIPSLQRAPVENGGRWAESGQARTF